MTRKDGSLALLVVVVWGLNFVVIKLGIAQYAAADAGGPALYAGRLPGAAVCRPAGHSAAPAAGHGLTISFGQFAFVLRYRPGMRRAGVAGAAGAVFNHHSGAPSSLANAYRASRWRGSRWRSSACWCWRRGASAGSMSHWWGFMLTLAAAFQLACGNITNKNHVPGDPPANHIAGGVERI